MNKHFDITFSVLVIGICSWMFFSSFSSEKDLEESSFVQYHFAFNVNPTYNSGIVNYAVIGVNNGRIVSKKPLSVTNFILQAMGRQQSAANPMKQDLFADHGLQDCFYKYDSIRDVYMECFTLEDLWALRYNRNPICPEGCVPMEGMRIKGWAQNKTYPSWPQIQILQQYGVTHPTDFFYGENMFKLFQDMEDPNWIDTYMNATE